MSSYTSITIEKLSRLIGTANTPVLIDVRTDADFAEDPRTIPGALRRPYDDRLGLGEDLRKPFGDRDLPQGSEIQRGCRRVAAAFRRVGRNARWRI